MAARTNKIRHDDQTRAKIQTSQIINRLYNHIVGELELSQTQIRAAEILLKKTLPDLTAAENKTEVTHRYVARTPDKQPDAAEWGKAYAPELTQH